MGWKAFCNKAKVNAYMNRPLAYRDGLDDPFKSFPPQTEKEVKLLVLPRSPELLIALILAAISVSKHLKSFDASLVRPLCLHLRRPLPPTEPPERLCVWAEGGLSCSDMAVWGDSEHRRAVPGKGEEPERGRPAPTPQLPQDGPAARWRLRGPARVRLAQDGGAAPPPSRAGPARGRPGRAPPRAVAAVT